MAFPAEFLQTVVEVGNECASQFVGEITLVDRVFRSFKSEPGVVGKTVSIPFPGSFTVNDEAGATPTYQAPTSTSVEVTLAFKPAVNFEVDDWTNLITAPNDVKQLYVEPALNALARYASDKIATKFVNSAGNFNTHTPVPSETIKTVTLNQIRDARILLNAAKVPVNDLNNMTLMLYPEAYDRALADDSFAKHDIAGPEASTAARRTGVILPQYAAQVMSDHSMPILSGTPNKYVSCLFHRYAIGLAARPLAIPEDANIKGSYVNHKGLLIRTMFGFNLTTKKYQLTFDYAMGLTVMRPAAGVLIYSNAA